ncbi:nucleoside-diphosphate sugar epimerase [Capsulimonas corticalis]|uniref:Nucleoside-diphosphate sugar epimerase n=1 Tax=Capsulimonas corticalis TaxID=2219043 RepID=A0A402CSL5_9BACT|nr:NmrA family NAD(P)-binding protein [Capsulimonas corticalis]BDI31042.1 nucleoside-diphosphate sugar epimerase [Capsulimonas corticalis]
MYAITGITGRVGGAAARALLSDGQSIRAVVRDPAKAQEWADLGAEIAVADARDIDAMTIALHGVEGAFLMIPPYFAPAPGFPEARAILTALREALAAAGTPKIVTLSSVGAHRSTGLGLITQSHLLEEILGELPISQAHIRAAWFLENTAWDIEPARSSGIFSSYLHPLDRAIPMVATADIGQTIAATLPQTWTGRRILELEGPRPYAPTNIAAALAALVGRPVQAVEVPREQWAANFEAQGTAPDKTAPRIEMLDGFNSGWITFEGDGAEHIVGSVTMEEALRG